MSNTQNHPMAAPPSVSLTRREVVEFKVSGQQSTDVELDFLRKIEGFLSLVPNEITVGEIKQQIDRLGL